LVKTRFWGRCDDGVDECSRSWNSDSLPLVGVIDTDPRIVETANDEVREEPPALIQ